MKSYSSKLVLCVIISCFCLTGFKQHAPKKVHVHKHQFKEEAKQQKKLDLSVPKREISFQEPPEIITTAQTALPDIDIDNNKNEQSLELKGKVIMSQEPEVGKIRSADGAGIQINLRH